MRVFLLILVMHSGNPGMRSYGVFESLKACRDEALRYGAQPGDYRRKFICIEGVPVP